MSNGYVLRKVNENMNTLNVTAMETRTAKPRRIAFAARNFRRKNDWEKKKTNYTVAQ